MASKYSFFILSLSVSFLFSPVHTSNRNNSLRCFRVPALSCGAICALVTYRALCRRHRKKPALAFPSLLAKETKKIAKKLFQATKNPTKDPHTFLLCSAIFCCYMYDFIFFPRIFDRHLKPCKKENAEIPINKVISKTPTALKKSFSAPCLVRVYSQEEQKERRRLPKLSTFPSMPLTTSLYNLEEEIWSDIDLEEEDSLSSENTCKEEEPANLSEHQQFPCIRELRCLPKKKRHHCLEYLSIDSIERETEEEEEGAHETETYHLEKIVLSEIEPILYRCNCKNVCDNLVKIIKIFTLLTQRNEKWMATKISLAVERYLQKIKENSSHEKSRSSFILTKKGVQTPQQL